MQQKRTPPTSRTGTPGIYKRCNLYVAKWHEEGRVKRASFPTYEEACAFRRDYILPYRRRVAGGIPPSNFVTRRAPKGAGGWVYFVRSAGPDELVKIGWTTDPCTRLRNLSVANAYGVELVALLPGSSALEKKLHKDLEGWRRGGEWFSREVLNVLRGRILEAL